MTSKCKSKLLWAHLLLAPALSTAQPVPTEPFLYEEVLVTGGKDAIRTLSGSASFLDEDDISKFDSTDLNELLGQVPGVYIRFEDGYGLRPNIGIRGATSDRSQKITLMEDGMLIAPAPYSAPAAYYIPNVNRMSALEVYKGPAAIAYGPHTVGGAINLVTPGVPETNQGLIDVSLGTDDYRKARLTYGGRHGDFGYFFDALHYGADGFKQLDSGGDTGFERNDVNLRLLWEPTGKEGSIEQRLELKLGFADEDSEETYLGLTDADFSEQSDRRYVASELDRFESEHLQAHLLHKIGLNDKWDLFTTAYINRFDRSWNKFDGFIDGQDPSLVLAYPDIFIDEIALLRGEQFSDPNDEATIIDRTNNDRQYGSQGIESRLSYEFATADVEHQLSAGIRFHRDYVERDHKTRGYLMTETGLVSDGLGERSKKALNEAESDAWSLFVSDTIDYQRLSLTLGLRYENIQGEFDDYLNDSSSSNDQDIWLPGAGIFYELSSRWGLLLGVNKGFSPAGPSAQAGVEPEESVNYEYGLRFTDSNLSADLIGFFSDYSNLLGRCRASDSGCNVGDEFNGGAVEISGAEFTLTHTGSWVEGLVFPVQASYTYTDSAFQDTFQSGFSQWGLVREGDELPYIPEHQGLLQVGVSNHAWRLDLSAKYIGKMRELPGQGDLRDSTSTKDLLIIGLAASYDISDQIVLRVVGENLTDEDEIVSRRPFGARPNHPRAVKFGVSYSF